MYFEAFLSPVDQQDVAQTIHIAAWHIPYLNRRAVVIVVVHRHYNYNFWLSKPVPVYTEYICTHVLVCLSVCRDGHINVLGGKRIRKVFAFWFLSSYCPVLWPRIYLWGCGQLPLARRVSIERKTVSQITGNLKRMYILRRMYIYTCIHVWPQSIYWL